MAHMDDGAPDHRASTSSRTSSILSRRERPSTRTSRTFSSTHRQDASTVGAETTPPRILSSPSVASSFGMSASSVLSPLRKEVELQRAKGSPIPRPGSGTGTQKPSSAIAHAHAHAHANANDIDSVRASKQELARRLSLLAQRLTFGDSMEELAALDSQVNQIEQALGGGGGINMGMSMMSSMSGSGILSSPLSHRDQRRQQAATFQTPMRHSRSDLDGGLFFSSPASSLYRSHHSDAPPWLSRHEEEWEVHEPQEGEVEQRRGGKKGMTAEQADKVLGEMLKLNEELATVVQNLQARQEEADHIHKLLIERAERAAQRIIFLQNRITYLEQELQENDHELQHLRVSLKQVEIQMPRHPDMELQRCFSAIREDYQALKRKRAHRSSMVSFLGYDQAIANASPTRLK